MSTNEQTTTLNELRYDCARQQKKGLHFILASVFIWAAIMVVHLTDLPIETKNILTFCVACPLMPLAWAIRGRWVYPEMKRVTDDFISSFTQPQAKLIWQILDFLLDLFPDNSGSPASAEVRTYWRDLAEAPERFHVETPEEKSILLKVLLEAAQDHKIIPKD
jgi:hypothetical protein